MAGKQRGPELEKLSEDTYALFETLNGESDLAAVLIAVSYLDACLVATLRKRLRPGSTLDRLLTPAGVLGSFSARADLSYVLGSLNKTVYQDLICLSEIRNLFAHHHLERSFSDPEIADKCMSLRYVASSAKDGEPNLFASGIASPRGRFIITVAMLSQRLVVSGLGATPLQPPPTNAEADKEHC